MPGAGAASADDPVAVAQDDATALLQISAARSIADTGLIGYLVKQFTRDNPDIDVRVQAVGAVAALEHGYSGETDLIITHYPPGEERLVSRGYGSERVEFMYSEFAFLGPRNDPLQLAASGGYRDVLQRLSNTEPDMFVPSPRSGTLIKLQELWASAGIEPAADPV